MQMAEPCLGIDSLATVCHWHAHTFVTSPSPSPMVTIFLTTITAMTPRAAGRHRLEHRPEQKLNQLLDTAIIIVEALALHVSALH
jgi:hypothetical protein